MKSAEQFLCSFMAFFRLAMDYQTYSIDDDVD